MNYLITGVSKGLGLETTSQLLHAGNMVFGISRSKSEELSILEEKFPKSLKWISYDLSKSLQVKNEIFKEWIGFQTEIHGFVNNAAYAYDDIITNLDVKTLEKMYEVNVFTPMIITKYVLRHMLLHSIQGSIIHVSSISVHTGYKGLAMYASSKGALEAFSKNTAREWGTRGIRSNCIVAGFMDTNMTSTLDESQKNRIYKRTSMKKPVEIESVASTIFFLLSDHSSSITGQNIHVDVGTI